MSKIHVVRKHLVVAALLALALGGCSDLTANGDPKPNPTTPVVDPNLNGGTTPDPVSEIIGKHEQEACKLSKEGERYGRGDCEEGLVCAPDVYDVSVGACRVDCSKIEDDTLTKDASKCPAGRSCQIAVSLELEELGAFCLPKQASRDAKCQAVGDADSCSDKRLCLPSEMTRNDAGDAVATSFICRDSCSFGSPDADSKCATGEKCIASAYGSTPQTDEAGEMVTCQDDHCTPGNAACECKVAEGFLCKPFIPGLLSICERSAGMCAAAVSWATDADFVEAGFSGQPCNEVSDHRFCDQAPVAGLQNAAEPTCIQFPNGDGRGFCFAFCSAPALDLDGDGKLGDEEKGGKLACPTGFECSLNLGRTLGLARPIQDATTSVNKACDPSKCEAGKPCAAECGLGDAECLSYDGRDGTVNSFCGAPFGSCQPSAS